MLVNHFDLDNAHSNLMPWYTRTDLVYVMFLTDTEPVLAYYGMWQRNASLFVPGMMVRSIAWNNVHKCMLLYANSHSIKQVIERMIKEYFGNSDVWNIHRAVGPLPAAVFSSVHIWSLATWIVPRSGTQRLVFWVSCGLITVLLIRK